MSDYDKIANLEEVIAKKDAEIASLKDKNTEAFKAVLNRDKEIARLRTLIGELADALDGFMDAPCDSCMLNRCPGIEKCKETKGTIELVEKARKVIGVRDEDYSNS